MPMMREPEPIFYYISPEWYKGGEPPFYDVEQLPTTKVLRENYPAIRREIEAYYADHDAEIEPNFTPYAYAEEGWRTVNLYSYFLRYGESCEKFPTIDRIVREIPGMSLAQVAVLYPNVRIKAHIGDTNALIRHHLGIVVPGGLPDIGIQVGRERKAWVEGDVLALQIARRHYAWNYTDRHRIVLVVDVFRPEYMDRRYEIASKALAAIAMKFCATKMPVLKRLPRPLVRGIHRVTAWVFRARLALQNALGRGA
jgi:aspartyl/asparaginyl beta-hydroxylase (cupin superfamily)